MHVAIGQKGLGSGSSPANSGSGGTFVIRECSNGSFEPIVIAGGAGGDTEIRANEWCNAQLNEFGNGSKSAERNNNIGGSGKSGRNDGYNGGAGYKTNAPNSTTKYPNCFENGLEGGLQRGLHDDGYIISDM